ncbi:MAG TPA: hypothetical protein VIF09_06715 [Polyangiaceae bacterium]|jgi:hypothetical protein
MRGAGVLAGVLAAALVIDLGGGVRDAAGALARRDAATACEGNRPAMPTLFYELRSGAFPSTGRPDVAVHVPPGFDATRHPSMVVYFHGWNGCVGTALADDDAPCSDGGAPRRASGLARQLDDAGVNALLVAVELSADAPSGDPGDLMEDDGLRTLLSELLAEHLSPELGCTLELERLDRVVVVAHSGGYQAAAAVMQRGGVALSEVVLLDAYYGADEVFRGWARDAVDDFDGTRRFVDLYTCCGGTLERSRALTEELRTRDGAGLALYDDDGPDFAEESAAAPVVVARVPEPHAEVPFVRFGSVLRRAGMARVDR